MNKNLILKSDILDIIFEKRNKAYGAYDLRKFYPNRLKLALGLMLIIAMGFSAFTLLPQKVNNVSGRIYEIPETKLKEVDSKPNDPVKEPKAEKTVDKDPVAGNQKIFRKNLLVVDDLVKADTINTLLPDDIIGTVNINGPTSGLVLVQPVNTEPGNGGTEKITPKNDNTIPMDIDAVDILPAYPGGMDALNKFLERNLHNPDDLENGETINVRIKFVVGYNGKLQSFVTVLDGGEAYNKEVVRVLRKMPDWVPGKAKGENVPVYYTIPVKFVMSD
jgi:periplasmic protein TonB